MESIATALVFLFGLFIIAVGLLQLFAPAKATTLVAKAGSTKRIHTTELLSRMVPAFAMVIHAPYSPLPFFLKTLGYLMIATSMVLLLLPHQNHHRYALWCAGWLLPIRMRLLSLPSFLLGSVLIYASI